MIAKRPFRYGYWELSRLPSPQNERPPTVRRRKAEIRHGVNNDLQLGFCEEALTSYAGLELIGRFLRRVRLNDRIRQCFSDVLAGGDFGIVALVRVVLGLLIVGGRRCGHVSFLEGDPVFVLC